MMLLLGSLMHELFNDATSRLVNELSNDDTSRLVNA